jgi:hypothetical protein
MNSLNTGSAKNPVKEQDLPLEVGLQKSATTTALTTSRGNNAVENV